MNVRKLISHTIVETGKSLFPADESILLLIAAHILTDAEIGEAKKIYAAQSKDYEEAFAAAMEAMSV